MSSLLSASLSQACNPRSLDNPTLSVPQSARMTKTNLCRTSEQTDILYSIDISLFNNKRLSCTLMNNARKIAHLGSECVDGVGHLFAGGGGMDGGTDVLDLTGHPQRRSVRCRLERLQRSHMHRLNHELQTATAVFDFSRALHLDECNLRLIKQEAATSTSYSDQVSRNF